jgi:hypothetical protein
MHSPTNPDASVCGLRGDDRARDDQALVKELALRMASGLPDVPITTVARATQVACELIKEILRGQESEKSSGTPHPRQR